MARTNAAPRVNVAAEKQQQAQLRVIRNEKTVKFKLGMRFYSSLSVLIGLVVFSIFCRVQLTEMTEAISGKNKELAALESEELRIRSELEEALSKQNIEKEAENLGMKKILDYQVEYVNISRNDVVSVCK